MKNNTLLKIAKILLLIIGLLPFIDFTLLMIFVGNDVPTSDPFFVNLGIVMFLSIPALLIFYIANVFRNTTVAKNQRALWVFLLFGLFAVFPFYWYRHIWQDTNEAQAGQIEQAAGNSPTKKGTTMNKVAILIAGLLPIVFEITAVFIKMNEPDNVLFYVFGVLVYISLIILIVLYIIDVYRNRSVAQNQRTLWTVLLIVGNMLVFPVYWYLHIWREPKSNNI